MHDTDPRSRTLVIRRMVHAPRSRIWAAWSDPDVLPRWWGPDGFSCRTERIDLRAGGTWVFDMIGPDGTVYPNCHRYQSFDPVSGIDYTLHWGADGPKHADATVRFEAAGDNTIVTLTMVFASIEEFENAHAAGAGDLGQQTLAKLAHAIGAGSTRQD